MELDNFAVAEFLDKVEFDKRGLVPAILQDINTGQVLMLAYMSKESINKMVETGKATFYSRSRQELWLKGETSGNYQLVKEISLDCDGDSILVKVEPEGPACHTGNQSCFYREFYREANVSGWEIIYKLEDIIKSRKINLPENSYTTSLFKAGNQRIGQKVGEEAVETVIAALMEPERLAEETADLIYHLIVLLVDTGLSLKEIQKELIARY
ncbi:MAG: bifunctional phosphoribosyl-AMP cyclohydrolase/phosphoribosyl-ATP diphosphatase HisIE [Halarsenatibacteraceae bacterium]